MKNAIFKRWLAALLAVMVLTLAACGSAPATDETHNTTSTASTDTSENTVLDETDSGNDAGTAEDSPANTDTDTGTSSGSSGGSASGGTSSGGSDSSSGSNSSDSSSSGVGTGKTDPVSPSSIPPYSGKLYITLNGGIPNFSAAELTTKGYETYSPLDSLGRCGAAVASLGKETMPAPGEDRGSISSIKPSGWVQANYGGKYLYNRSHLIGWQLSAENANKQNLITGTAYFNQTGMIIFENMVADYIKETGNHVAYRVTPIFSGNNLLAHGVQMEAYSVEDDGEGICFNVFIYNVQPNVEIDYATGSSKSAEEKAEEEEKQETSSAETHTYILNINPSSMKFHFPNCSSVQKMSEKNKQEFTGTRDEAIANGYSPCGNCKP